MDGPLSFTVTKVAGQNKLRFGKVDTLTPQWLERLFVVFEEKPYQLLRVLYNSGLVNKSTIKTTG